MIEQIQWIPTADRLPDDNTTVLIIVKNATEPCWPGYIDGGLWFYTDGILIINDRPVYWAHMPEGPIIREIFFIPPNEINNQKAAWMAWDGQFRNSIPGTTPKSTFYEALDAAVIAWGKSWSDAVEVDFYNPDHEFHSREDMAYVDGSSVPDSEIN